MPERWERELRKLHGIEMPETSVRERVERGSNIDREPPRRDRLVAGVVAATVSIGAIAFLWQAIPDEEGRDIGGPADELPTLVVTFESNGLVVDEPDEQVRRVDTTIEYGDAREESFTSAISRDAQVDWVGVGDLTRFLPGPTTGSPVRFEADGENLRVLIGKPTDWPEFERFTPIERLPDQPGDYVLVFEADYPDGVARTARSVHVVPPGMLQLVVTEGKSLYAATAFAYLDGSRTTGFLSSSWFTLGDVGAQSDPVAPRFGPDAWIDVPPGSPMLLTSVATRARAGLFETYEDLDLRDRLPIDLLGDASVIEGPGGQHLLAVDMTWRHGRTGWGQEGTEERALFVFPIEIVADAEVPTLSPEPSSLPSPSPSAMGEVDGGIIVQIFGLGERSNEMPSATFAFDGATRRTCTQDWEWEVEGGGTIPGGETVEGDTVCSDPPSLDVPPGTPISIRAGTAIDVQATRTTTQLYEGDAGLVVSTEWQEGRATFIVPLTVVLDGTSPDRVTLDCPDEDQVAFQAPTGPRILPGGSAYITGNLPGFLPDDVVEQMTLHNGGGAGGWDGTWQVVRDGSVIAVVEFDALSGVACRGSGIAGV